MESTRIWQQTQEQARYWPASYGEHVDSVIYDAGTAWCPKTIEPPELTLAFDNAGFFGDNAMIRKSLEQFVDNSDFGFAIDFADEIVAGFYFNLQVG